MNNFDDYMKERVDQRIKDLFEETFKDKNVSTSALSANLSLERLNEAIDKIAKYKIVWEANEFVVQPNKIVIFDHEQIRKDFPHWTERGKTVYYHPDDREELQKVLNEYGVIL